MVRKPACCAPVKHSRAVSSEGARTVHSGVRMVRTVCAPLILCALTSPASSYATRCSLLPPRSGEACKARHATWGCVQSQAAPPEHYWSCGLWLTPACVRHLAGKHVALLTSAVLLKNNTAGLATALEATRAGTSATHQRPIRAAAGRGPSDAVPAAPSRAYLHHGSRIGAEQEHTMA